MRSPLSFFKRAAETLVAIALGCVGVSALARATPPALPPLLAKAGVVHRIALPMRW
jgi:hypothetical protein